MMTGSLKKKKKKKKGGVRLLEHVCLLGRIRYIITHSYSGDLVTLNAAARNCHDLQCDV